MCCMWKCLFRPAHMHMPNVKLIINMIYIIIFNPVLVHCVCANVGEEGSNFHGAMQGSYRALFMRCAKQASNFVLRRDSHIRCTAETGWSMCSSTDALVNVQQQHSRKKQAGPYLQQLALVWQASQQPCHTQQQAPHVWVACKRSAGPFMFGHVLDHLEHHAEDGPIALQGVGVKVWGDYC